MKLKNKENILLLIFALYVILYFFRLGSVGLIDVDEPRYAEAAREMLELNNWIVPYFNYVVRFDKPIFFYWLEAISMKIFGVNEFSARLPSVMMALMTVGIFFYFLQSFYGKYLALIGALILMSCFEFIALSRFSITDMTLATFISSSVLFFFLGYDQISTSHRFFKLQIKEFSWHYVLGFIFLALAVLTKGPVAVIVSGLILVPFFWWIRKLEYFYRSFSFWIGFLIFLVLVIPWYLSVHFATEGEFTKIFFGVHNFSRYTGIVSGHKGSLFYFIPVVCIGFIPWIFFLPQSINSILNKGLKSLLGSSKEQIPWFFLWWFIVIFVFYSFSRTKLLTYILPLFLPLSAIVAFWFEALIVKKADNKGLVIGLGIFFLFSIILLGLCLFELNVLLPREIKDLKLDIQIMFFAFLLFVGVSMAWSSSHKNEGTTFAIVLSTLLLFYFCLVGFLLPKIDKHSQFMLRTFAKNLPDDFEVATYQIIKPSLTFYSRRHVQKIDSLGRVQKKLNEKNKFALVTTKVLIKGVQFSDSYLWGEDSRYVFLTNYPLEIKKY